VYAIGIMLYELTTGFRLYKGKSEFEILKKIVEDKITPPSMLRPGFPKDLETIVLKALAKDREQRYQTAQELQGALEAFAREHRLAISSIAMSAFMQKVFGNKIEAWREAQAAGKDLAAHIVARHDRGGSGPGASKSGVGDSLGGLSDPGTDGGELLEEDLEEERTDEKRGATPSSHGQVVPAPVAVAPAAAKAGRRRWEIFAAAGALVFVGVVLWAKLGGSGKSSPAAELSVAPPAPQPAPPEMGPPPPVVVPDAAPAPLVEIEAAGMAKVKSKPDGAKLWIDDQPWTERAPTVIDGLAPGEHVLRAELRGFPKQTVKFTVKSNETTSVTVELKAVAATPDKPPQGITQPPPPPDGAPGKLRIATTPSCEIMIDGKLIGWTPILGHELPAGGHTVRVINSQLGIDRTYTVSVKPAPELTKFKQDYTAAPK
jgi:serine/threonine-protein kinase